MKGSLMSPHIFNSNTCRILFATCLSALCLAALSAEAATITVMNGNDSGDGSLRQALADTNDGDTINFAVTGTITLTTDELLVDKSITISGPGSDNLTVDGNHASHVFHVSGGVTATVAGLSITNGGEVPGAGGGIYNDHSTLAIDHCTVSGNHGSVGGGVYNDGYSGSATLTVTNSTFSGNSVAAPYSVGSGGGIYNNGSYGSATLTVANSTFSGNSAGYLDYGWGGAIYNDGSLGSATLTLDNSTFSGNSAGYHGGGIYNGSGMVTIRHTILNAGALGENLSNAYGSVSSLGYNLSSDNGGGFLTATGDQINTDPMLGPLQDNGGPTFTHALLTGSPAIDAGDPNFTAPPDYDQRGTDFPRVFNGRVDIGAFEVQTVTPSYAAQVQPPINADGTSTFNVRRGVVPVKFNLTQGGVATCDLPPATIAVTRTAGGVIGQVNESVYSGNADTGSNFRIDSCQYVYNLNSRALGVGTYRVDMLIDGQVVGSAVFALQ
jgi:Chlamydia polymorphic membrane protein (Chlamydia_PMP) repeat